MTNQEYKHHVELSMISSILQSKGIPKEICECGDRPDIIIAISEKKVIGVEVTTYQSGNYTESANAFNKVLDGYCQLLDKKQDQRYLICVFFQNADLPHNLKFNRVKNELFKEIERCRINDSKKCTNKYIIEAIFDEAPFMKDSFATYASAFEYKETDEIKLIEIIEKKGKALINYKLEHSNFKINEWWLVIYYPITEQTKFESLNLTKNIVTDYDHIFLTEVTDIYKQIK